MGHRRSRAIHRLGSALVLALLAGDGRADSQAHQPLELLIERADFVGIVRCTTAGVITARYRVLDAWKGPSVPGIVTIRDAPDVRGPELPFALIGEDYLVFARAPTLRAPVSETSFDAIRPIDWRRLRTDHVVLMRGLLVPVLDDDESTATTLRRRLPTSAVDLAAFRREVVAYVEAPLAQRDLALLRALAIDAIRFSMRIGDPDEIAASARRIVQTTNDVDALLRALLELGDSADRFDREVAQRVFERHHIRGTSLVDRLTALPRAADAPRGEFLRKVLDQVLAGTGSTPSPRRERRVAFDAAELETFRGLIGGSRGAGAMLARSTAKPFRRAFAALTRSDPAFVVDALHVWRCGGVRGRILGFDRHFVSWFAHQCPTDRVDSLRRLSEAQDAWVAVIGASYLCLEAEEEGIDRLRLLCRVPGLARGYAALNLARRGDQNGIDLLLDVFAAQARLEVVDPEVAEFFVRFAVLLSNSAAASRVPLPERWELSKAGLSGWKAWWNDHRHTLTLADPWLPELVAQRVD